MIGGISSNFQASEIKTPAISPHGSPGRQPGLWFIDKKVVKLDFGSSDRKSLSDQSNIPASERTVGYRCSLGVVDIQGQGASNAIHAQVVADIALVDARIGNHVIVRGRKESLDSCVVDSNPYVTVTADL